MVEDKKEEGKTRKSAEEVLFPDIKLTVGGKEYTIRPWTFGELIEVNPDIEEIFIQLEKRGTKIDIEDFGFNTMKNIYFSVMPQAGVIIRKTIDITEEELNSLTPNEAIELALAIFTANKDALKNILSPFLFRMLNEE